MAVAPIFTIDVFADEMHSLGVYGDEAVAVAVSGGPDSMALCWLLARWAEKFGQELHVLSVDHGLRAESMREVTQVGAWIEDWPNLSHHILKWEAPTKSAVQEEARKARYDMMAEYCLSNGISQLLLAHHRDDQAETVLFRLAKGSGLDGLCGMQKRQIYSEALTLLRPLLDVDKQELLAFCADEEIPYFEDPSNENAEFARVRLRKARCVLEEEGLSAKRLAVTAQRLGRARKALENITDEAFQAALIVNDTKSVVFKSDALMNNPEEIILRCLLKGLKCLRFGADYAPRMEKIEALLYDLIQSHKTANVFRKRTLGGVMFHLDKKAGRLELTQEHV